jgi:hypothetical protein
MTETHPGPLASPPDHPDLDTLADFDAGVLAPEQAARLGGHVSACTRCRAILAGIGDVPRLLRLLPAPHIPPEVEARIVAALDAERLALFGVGPRPAAATPTAAPGPVGRPGAGVGSVAGIAAARERRRGRTRLVGMVAAGLVVIAAGATAVVGLHRGQPTTSAGGAASTADHQQGAGGAGQAAAPRLPSYDRQTITSSSLLTRILNGERGPLAAGGEGGLSAGRLSSCASGVARVVPGTGGGAPAGVQHILFEGRPGYLLVYASGSGRVLVVVAEGCSAEAPGVLYTRPL